MQNEHEVRLKELFHLLVTGFVDHVQDVKFSVEKDHSGYFITAKVNRADQRRIIGSGGRNVKAIRTVLRAYLEKHNEKLVDFLVVEPTVGKAAEQMPEYIDKDWTREKSNALMELIRDTISFLDPNVRVVATDQAFGETKIDIQPSIEYGPKLTMSLHDIFIATAKVRGRPVSLEFQDPPSN